MILLTMFYCYFLQAYNHHLEGVAPGRKRDGAVFRALPVYRVRKIAWTPNI